ncbi:MAG: FAD/NAD(P)-binding protein [Acetobacteraceae bacterium]|nr:FAD/NAD(P)-binding protein [Acetobacteraceae bacterium]
MSQAALLDPLVPLAYRVRRTRRELPDIATLELVPVAGEVPAFLPGQFNMLYAFGIGEVAISMSGDPAQRGVFVHTVRDVGAISGAISRLGAGAIIGVRGPYGTAWPTTDAEGSDVLIIAGGLGLAPLRPAIYQVLANRARYGHVAILYGARSPSEILYRAELERWRRQLDVQLAVTVDHADASWRGDVGVVPKLIPRAGFDPTNTIALVCGPEVMMRFTATALLGAGVPAEQIHLSMERDMKCAIGLCGHCQFGPDFVCKDGPVMRYDRIAGFFAVREI